jgi:hypothetical protein
MTIPGSEIGHYFVVKALLGSDLTSLVEKLLAADWQTKSLSALKNSTNSGHQTAELRRPPRWRCPALPDFLIMKLPVA